MSTTVHLTLVIGRATIVQRDSNIDHCNTDLNMCILPNYHKLYVHQISGLSDGDMCGYG